MKINKNEYTIVELMIVFAIFAILLVTPVSFFVNIPIKVSGGIRTGLVTKITDKGLFFKTIEGELMLGSGNSGHVWQFSILKSDNSEKIKKELAVAQEKQTPISLEYVEYFHLAATKAETNYSIIQIK